VLTKKINPTGVIVAVLTLVFIWSQWPTKSGTKMPDEWFYLTDEKLGYEVQFEQEPTLETISDNGQQIQLYVMKRKGIDFMLQVITPGVSAENEEQWLEASKALDVDSFNGNVVLDWNFPRGGEEVHEYVLTNNIHFANQVRVIFTPDAIYKLAVAFKEKDDNELLTRILTFLDSFSLRH